jgi:leader peptidase (prepilin peptidase)/N-methyltransferase
MGGLWGSFANVCIYRLPQDKGVVSGRSYCPKCKTQISWYDNIPILSYLFIQGKCRKCKKQISIQYLTVELISVLSFTTAYFFYGITITTLLFIILALIFIIIFFVDLKHYIIPNSLTFPLMFIGFVKSFDPNLNELFPNYINSLIGGVLGYGIIWLIIFLYKVLRNKEGMGLGDAKLLSAIGFWFGWISIPFVIFSSSIVALLTVLPSLINKSKKLSSEIPFGPFIIIGCILYIIFIEQYKNLLFG